MAALVVTSLASGLVGVGARGATKPPPPPGVAVLAPGALPHVCGEGDRKYGATGYSPVNGVYYSTVSNAWVSAPLCYPRWGNLKMSAPQIAAGGSRATVAAIPTDGSNSAEWAVKPPGAVQWAVPAPVAAGCKPTTLTCTVKLPAAGAEWQWLLFQVTMPRTYFIDSPGEFCAGQHACAGTATNGWTYVAVAPKGVQVKKKEEDTYAVSGHVRTSRCSPKSCTFVGLAGVVVTAQGPGGPVQATTTSAGAYTLEGLKPGTWNVKPALANADFSPDATTVVIRNQSLDEIDFETCAAKRTTQGVARSAEAFCRLLSVEAVPTEAAEPKLKELPVRLSYQGIGWDPKGGPIAIAFGGKPITKFPQAAGFKKQLYASEWPERDNLLGRKGGPVGCSATLTATQSGVTRIQYLSTPAVAVAIFADGDRVLRTGDAICGGEQNVLERSAGTVLVTNGLDFYGQIWVFQPRGGIKQAVNVNPGRPLCVALFPATRGHVTIVRSAANGAYQGRRGTGPCPP